MSATRITARTDAAAMAEGREADRAHLPEDRDRMLRLPVRRAGSLPTSSLRHPVRADCCRRENRQQQTGKQQTIIRERKMLETLKTLHKTSKNLKLLYKGAIVLAVLIAVGLTALEEYRNIQLRSGR